MLQYLHKCIISGQKNIFRQIRSLVILALVIISFWLVNHKFQALYYVLTGLGIIILIIDYNRPKKALMETSLKITDTLIIIGINVFLAGLILITGAAKSPLNGILLTPIILFTAEYGRTIGTVNFFIVSLFVIIDTFLGFNKFSWNMLGAPFAIILVTAVALTVISSFQYFINHYYQKVNRLLTLDELTGLYNRRFLRYAVLREVKAGKHFGFAMIDINYFKYYNDFWGHAAGDALLISLGKVFKANVRPQDIVIRHSGDEFIIMMPGADQTQVNQVLTQIVKTIESHHFPGEECFPDRKLSISYGTALYPNDASFYQELFTAADQALYRFKKERQNI